MTGMEEDMTTKDCSASAAQLVQKFRPGTPRNPPLGNSILNRPGSAVKRSFTGTVLIDANKY